jgi:hypothetical protein
MRASDRGPDPVVDALRVGGARRVRRRVRNPADPALQADRRYRRVYVAHPAWDQPQRSAVVGHHSLAGSPTASGRQQPALISARTALPWSVDAPAEHSEDASLAFRLEG